MRRVLILFGVVLLAVGSAGSALAIPITFDYTGGGGQLVHFKSFTGSDGLTTVLANEVPNSRDLFLGNDGLGVYGGDNIDSAEARSGYQVDGYGTNEAVTFAFSAEVRLTSISFDWVGRNDDFALYVGDGAGDFTLIDDFIDIPNGKTYDLSMSLISDIFKIAALGENDDFLIAGMEVETPTPTPEPASMLLLGTGLVGMAVAGRKKYLRSH